MDILKKKNIDRGTLKGFIMFLMSERERHYNDIAMIDIRIQGAMNKIDPPMEFEEYDEFMDNAKEYVEF